MNCEIEGMEAQNQKKCWNEMSPVPTKGLGFDGNGTIERECLQQSVYVISAVGLNNMRGPDVIYKRIPWLSLIE